MSKIVLVTGASAGFGIAIVKTLVADGYQVIACARRFDKLQELQAELGQDKVYPLQMDVAQPKAIDAALASLPEQWRAIDVLVNNAGLALGLDKAYEADFTDWMTMINTNIVGLIYLTRQVLPDMVKRNSGLIINLGSTAGTVPYQAQMFTGHQKPLLNNSPSIYERTLQVQKSACLILNQACAKEQNFQMCALREMMSELPNSTKEHMLFNLRILLTRYLGLPASLSTLISIASKSCLFHRHLVRSPFIATNQSSNTFLASQGGVFSYHSIRKR